MQPSPSEVIDAIGGTAVTAKLCKVSEAAVSQWRKDGIPDSRLMFLKLARPRVFKAFKQAEKAEADLIKRNGGIRQTGDSRDAKNISN